MKKKAQPKKPARKTNKSPSRDVNQVAKAMVDAIADRTENKLLDHSRK